jgi:hypothetical protein
LYASTESDAEQPIYIRNQVVTNTQQCPMSFTDKCLVDEPESYYFSNSDMESSRAQSPDYEIESQEIEVFMGSRTKTTDEQAEEA